MKQSFLFGGIGSAVGSLLTYYLMKNTIFENKQNQQQQNAYNKQQNPNIEVLGSYYGYFPSNFLRAITFGIYGNEGIVKSKVLSHECNGKTQCSLLINNKTMLGDPAKVHDKVFKYQYRCNKWNADKNQIITGEILVDDVKENQTVVIDCNKKPDITKYLKNQFKQKQNEST